MQTAKNHVKTLFSPTLSILSVFLILCFSSSSGHNALKSIATGRSGSLSFDIPDILLATSANSLLTNNSLSGNNLPANVLSANSVSLTNNTIALSTNVTTSFSENGLPANFVWGVSFNYINKTAYSGNGIYYNLSGNSSYSFQVFNSISGNQIFMPSAYPANLFSGSNYTIQFVQYQNNTLSNNDLQRNFTNNTTVVSVSTSLSTTTLLPVNTTSSTTTLNTTSTSISSTTTTIQSTTSTIPPAYNTSPSNTKKPMPSPTSLESFLESRELTYKNMPGTGVPILTPMAMNGLVSIDPFQVKNIMAAFSPYVNHGSDYMSLINRSITVNYGGITQNGKYAHAGSKLLFAAYSNNTLSFYNVTVTKAKPRVCIYTNLVPVPYCDNATAPLQIRVPIIDGKYGLTGNSWYPLNITFNASLLGNNTANFNYSVKDITNGTVLVPLTATSGNRVNAIREYRIPVTQKIEISFSTSGNSNYSKIIDDPVTAPTSIDYYLPITFTNSQTSGIPNPFQLRLNINESNYSAYLNSRINNTEFFYANGTLVPSWLEGNATSGNEQLLQQAHLVTYWLLVTGSFLPASSSNTLYMGFASNTLSLLNYATDGVSPEVTCATPSCTVNTYGEYDDGKTVFTYYDNFLNSSDTSGWGISSSATATASEGLTFITSAASQYYIYTLSNFSGYFVYDLYGRASSASSTSQGIDIAGLLAPYTTSLLNYYASALAQPKHGKTLTWEYVFNGGVATSSVSTPSPTLNSSHLFGLSGDVESQNYTINYTVIGANKTTAVLPYSFYPGVTADAGANDYIEYVRVRQYPPGAGVMPAATFGSVSAVVSNSTCQISLSPNSLTFGSFNTLSTIPTSQQIADTNGGTAAASIFLSGSNWVDPPASNASSLSEPLKHYLGNLIAGAKLWNDFLLQISVLHGVSQFGVSNTTWAGSSGVPFSSANALTSSLTNTGLTVPAGTSANVFVGLRIPGGVPEGIYIQNITVDNSC